MSRGEVQDGMDYGFPPARGGRGAPSMFPRKLYQILCETDPEIISWDDDGKSFHIANYEEYIEGVMPLFYRHNKLTSFQRQLNLYGFKKRGRDEKNPGHYYHPYFQRDRPEILGGVRRSYPVTSPKWVTQGSSGTPSASSAAGRAATAARAAAAARTAAAAAAAAAAAEAGHGPGSPSSPRRARGVAGFPPREEVPGRSFGAARQEPDLPPHYRHHHSFRQQQQQQQQHPRHAVPGSGGGYGPMFDERTGMVMDGEDPTAMMMIPGRDEDGGVAGGSCNGARKRPSPSQGGWFYTSSNPAVSEGVAAARLKRATDGKAEMAGGNDHPAAAGHPWAAGAARGNPYARSGAGAAAAAAASAAGGPPEKSARRDSYRYAPTNGRHWETYRDQEDSYPLHPKGGGVGWYDSEESGLSRLTSCDSASSTWDEMHVRPGAGGGGDVFDRSRSRAMAAMEMAPADAGGAGGPGGGRDPRDPLRDRGGYPPHHPADGPEMMDVRPMAGGPGHRGTQTSAMFPAHLLRHDRFGRYPQGRGAGGAGGGGGVYDYPAPPPPMYAMPSHAYAPDPDPGAPSRWRPVYNGGRGGPVDGPGGGGPVSGSRGDDGFDGWRDGPAGRLPGEGAAAGKVGTAAAAPSAATAAPAAEWEEPPTFEEMAAVEAEEKQATAAATGAGAAAGGADQAAAKDNVAAAAAAAAAGGSGKFLHADDGQDGASKISEPQAAVGRAAPTETAEPAEPQAESSVTAAENGAAAAGSGVDEKTGGVCRAASEELVGEGGGRDGGSKGEEEREKTTAAPAPAPVTGGGFHFTVPKSNASAGAVSVGNGVASLGMPMAATAV